ncbi:hypothetical protein J4457_07435 [Candidatus Woesearchaeota archaeon]|nr:hypothetical protein [Candidatus Woesearchaeota archaeon]
MTFWSAIGNGISAFWGFFLYWLSILFILPFGNLDVLWILIPIWLNLVFTDLFQEKRGTSLGNAITNGAVMLWVGIDWARFLIRNFSDFSGIFAFKVVICTILVIAGFMIIVEGIKGKKVIQRIARCRETSYVMIVLSPLIYNIIQPSWKYFFAIIVFLPVFYFIFEFFDRLVPDVDTY